MMNRDTLGKVRQLKDNQGRYLLNDGINGPTRELELNGRPVVIADDLPNEAANAFPIFYGHFRAGYTIVDNGGLYTKEDSSTLADQDMTSYLFFRRTGGKVVLPEALVKIKCAV
jgi:HK97 family phage major capsid protein